MFEFPDLKFEKSCNYLEDQLQLHNNNKERILDMINNANLDSKKAKNIKSSCYANFVDDANKVLETISNNISSIESLNSQLQNLNVELNSIITVEPPKTKGKKLFLKTCTDLKDNLIAYSKDFEEMESKLNLDNIYFSEFINKATTSYVSTEKKAIKRKNKKVENIIEDIEYSIIPDFINKIQNTTSFEFEDISYIDTVAQQSEIITNNSIENTVEIIECIEIEKEFAEEIQKINKSIDNELLPEVKNIENITNLQFFKENRKSIYKKQKTSSKENLTKDSFIEKVEKIKNADSDNKTLIISEHLGNIYLPYKISELLSCVEINPKKYTSLEDVVKQEFTLPFQFFKNQSSKSRFSEAFKLSKNRDNQGFIKSVSYAFRISTKRNLNPVIIAACKTKFELESYIYYLDSNNLNNFKFFNIIYEVNPLKNNKDSI